MSEAWTQIIITTLTLLGAVASGLIAARYQLAHIPIEKKASDADAAASLAKAKVDEAEVVAKYQEIAEAQAEANRKLRNEIANVREIAAKDVGDVRKEVESLRKTLDGRDATIRERDQQIITLQHTIIDQQDWISRLIHQIKSHGIDDPVPFRTSYTDVDAEALQRLLGKPQKTDPTTKPK